MGRAGLVRVVVAMAVVLVAIGWASPASASASGVSSSYGCADVRPGPAPVIDRVGRVGVPKIYCYDPGDDHKGWHDFCSFGQGDTWSKGGGVVSFEGPCAYHDLCLEYGWGFDRATCDDVFRVYMRRNCVETIRTNGTPAFLRSWITHLCRGKADRMYTGVHLYTEYGHAGYRRGNWGCLVAVSQSTVSCSRWYGVLGSLSRRAA